MEASRYAVKATHSIILFLQEVTFCRFSLADLRVYQYQECLGATVP